MIMGGKEIDLSPSWVPNFQAAEDARVIYRYFHVNDSKENVAWHSGDRGVYCACVLLMEEISNNHLGCVKPYK